ncbi:MAG: BamA/TamA family outer membrane protein [Pseudanabaena sp. M158S2SP1A06QC]|jgi:outer membrane protein insertion porin family|nr:BamA/TamA family outer membrane protein [Pseudanabaena sp. M051S1SP1A06QC]MCA6588879.1 BamA/TamA family outer membrane protein [Pseudanabaena sp. M109S1SP1A06QC]MCA6612786.1 BamA/TamA family outer membrane protein [Pseudanabaena sp. M158S2SP1A06QC]MCA6616224.1 BamA/TamA family outer membrane protein [Pseudanabaena sp. M090S1SP1A06QC]MCA6621333.1 BamA/TamA family outer membrane protein [Pseudanabaena sp. M165S2SP1A06QC]MCE2977309.1 BamA/TamA family outer membrane protein [Pseudanabaena sp. C
MRINLLVFTAIAASSTLLANPLLAKTAPAKQEIAQAPTSQPTATPTPSPQPTTPAPPVPTTPTETPSSPTFTLPSNTPAPPPAAEVQVLVGEVTIKTPEGQDPLPPELQQRIYDAITTKPGRTVTKSQLQSDINTIFATGFFSNVQAEPEDTDIGVRVTFFVLPNPVLKSVNTEGTKVLEAGVIDRIFGSQIGKITNLKDVQTGVKELEKYYQDKGYVLAQVVDIKATPEGNINLVVSEGVIEDIKVAFINEDGKSVDKDGKPVTGNTRDFIITRELTIKEGEIFNKNTVQSDLQKVFALGLFEDLNIGLAPGTDPRKVIVTVNVKERNTGSIAAGAGISSSTGLFGTVSFQQQNLGGNNQKLGLDVQVGERELLFDLNFTDPWLAGDPYRTSFSANIFNRRLFSYVFDSPIGIGTSNDTPRINRLGTGFSFSRPLGAGTTASLGLRYERVSITDSNNAIATTDSLGNPLTTSGTGQDDLLLLQFAYANDQRDNPIKPSSGSVFRIATEQSIPVGLGSIFLNRVRASYSYFFPVKLLNFSEGTQALAFNIQAGTVIGTLPPYEAFQLGGSNSVRGWDEGKIGSGRSFGIFSAEYRFPVFNIVGGVLFFDYGTDLGSASAVPGNPAVARNKPGNGAGYGIGVRVQSPLGAIRVDYGLSSNGGTQFSFGLGEKF